MNGMFTDRVKKVMQIAREESVRLGNDYVGTEHLLLGLIKEGDGVAVAVMNGMGVDLDDLAMSIEKAVTSAGGMMTVGQMLPFTPRAKKVLELAANEARSMSHKYIGTEHLLLALMKDTESAAANALAAAGLEYDRVKEEISRVLKGGEVSGGVNGGPGGPKEKSKTPFMDHFGRDLTAMAKDNKLDPVIGREKEIERVVQILSRRKKNNPVLIGEPGIGKTAIVEGLAQKIIEKNIPQVLENKRVINLDMASMVAGTKYRGQFEERLKALMVELQKNDNIIIFIDELHTIVGAGGSEGSLDASNIFKPALSRGEIQCVGATTLDEYRKYIEKDGALARRFQTIMVDPPSVAETIQIISGLRHNYEEHHKVTYTEKAIEAAVKFSDRYISDRFLPDKAIDVIDEAGARKRLSSMEIPTDIRDIEKEIAEVLRDKELAVEQQEFERAAQLRDKQEKLNGTLLEQKALWRKAKAEERLLVDESTINEVIATMTGIPLTRLAEEETKKILHLEDELRRRVIGQDEALGAVARSIRRSRAGLHNTRRPIASFIFLGPTGVGKTELAKALAQSLFDTDDALVRIDMSEYMEKHAVSRLVGAPPGYVGYEEGGQLTEKIRKKPYSVILLDEIEKAHPDVFNILLQVLDDGILTDSYGRHVNFKNTVIIMTSNAGSRDVKKTGTVGFGRNNAASDYEAMKSKVMDEMKRIFNPEFINRIDETIVFAPLGKDEIARIVDIQLNEVQERLVDRGIKLIFTEAMKKFLVDKGYDPVLGARPLRRSIQRSVEDPLAEEFLLNNFGDGDIISLETDDEGVIFKKAEAVESGV
ncbi:MAG: ATP-dependent Clp protease ATP-binding subunit [Chitinispirillia bacterium]|nr:ATP-dependent Clp protease ATP-binding subunit [Chitinispirillia bacterium]MCL2241180.1 ATP-dependent Clp protease ATP-binding subunit [Chitinispirillia bacterium]